MVFSRNYFIWSSWFTLGVINEMKVMQINIVFNNGSTGKIVNDIHHVLLTNNHDSIVCYGAGNDDKLDDHIHKIVYRFELTAYRILAHLVGLQYASGLFSTIKLIKMIKQEKPDIVHLHCINGFFINVYKVLEFLKQANIKTVLTLHAEFMYTGSCGYAYECDKWQTGCGKCPQLWPATYSLFFDRTATAWLMMKDAFTNFDNIIITSVSPWLTKRAKTSPILKNKQIITIENGIDTKNVFYPRESIDLKQSLNMGDAKVVLHVTANFSDHVKDIKGGRYIIALARLLQDQNVKIVVVGTNNTNIELPNNIISVGKVNDQNILAQYYSMADLSVITSKRETFSMPVAESLSCGTPVVGFLAGGPETISIEQYSEFVEYGNTQALSCCILRWLKYQTIDRQNLAAEASKRYSKELMTYHYLDVYKSFI